MKRLTSNLIYGCMGGIILYVDEFLCSILAYFTLSYELFCFFFLINIIISSIILIWSIIHKSAFILDLVIRFIIIWVFYLGALILGGCTGIVLEIFNLCGIKSSSLTDNLSGLITLFFLLIMMGVCLFTIIVTSIYKALLASG